LADWWDGDALQGSMWRHVQRCMTPEDDLSLVATWFRPDPNGRLRGSVHCVECKHVACTTVAGPEKAEEAVRRASEIVVAVVGSLRWSAWQARGPHVPKAVASLLLGSPNCCSEFAEKHGLCFFVPWMVRGDGTEHCEVMLVGDAASVSAAKTLLDETVSAAAPRIASRPAQTGAGSKLATITPDPPPAVVTRSWQPWAVVPQAPSPEAESVAVAAAVRHAEMLMHQLAMLHRQHMATSVELDLAKRRLSQCTCGTGGGLHSGGC
jgi:hypothetical protein